MYEIGLDEKLERPINGRRRGFSTFTIEAIQYLVGSGRLVTAPNQLEDTTSQPCQAKSSGMADTFCPFQGSLDTILVIVMRRGKVDCG